EAITNCRFRFSCTLRASAISTIDLIRSKASSGSPPWNSILIAVVFGGAEHGRESIGEPVGGLLDCGEPVTAQIEHEGDLAGHELVFGFVAGSVRPHRP
ncbi:MAG TPA: hypothetical protein VHN14_21535, partial [Kofleriaceae bacterium]|nr:hypothetical protein [Kofleriaceae bacterium]